MSANVPACLLALLMLCLVEVGSSKDAEQVNSTVTAIPNKTTVTKHTKHYGLLTFKLDTSMIQRALYVLIVSTVVGMLYFLVRAVRLKKITTPRKKYGLLTNYDDTVEMAQLESDEEDTTVYEARSLRR